MRTVDLELGLGSGWIAVVPETTIAYIHNNSDRVVYYRFGADSTSFGSTLKPSECIKVDETVYFRDNLTLKIKLVVTYD